MNEKFNKNANVEKFTTMLGRAVRLIVIDPLHLDMRVSFKWRTVFEIKSVLLLSAIEIFHGNYSDEVFTHLVL